MSELVGLLNRLPVLASRAAAKLAKEQGRKPRTERPFGSLTSWSSQPSVQSSGVVGRYDYHYGAWATDDDV
jgi:hypothetical protein